jgi:hypothetical protein
MKNTLKFVLLGIISALLATTCLYIASDPASCDKSTGIGCMAHTSVLATPLAWVLFILAGIAFVLGTVEFWQTLKDRAV